MNHLDQWLNQFSVYLLKWTDNFSWFDQRFFTVFAFASDNSEQTVLKGRLTGEGRGMKKL